MAFTDYYSGWKFDACSPFGHAMTSKENALVVL